MAIGRGDSFQLALAALRERLREGRLPPGERIAAIELAQDLGVSATPVREALSRLAGEGLIEDRRGQGYFARSISALDVADLYRLSMVHLGIALDAHRTTKGEATRVAAASAESVSDPVLATERLFLAWVHSAGGRSLATAFRTLTVQLGPVRRIEPVLFADLTEEVVDLLHTAQVGDVGVRLQSVRRFHARRIAVADRLSNLLERGGETPKV